MTNFTNRLSPQLVMGTAVVTGLLWWPSTVAMLALVVVVRRVQPAMQERESARRRVASLPDVVDLIVIAISSGETITGSLRLVSAEGPLAVRPGFQRALDHLAAGGSLADGLQQATDHLGSEYRSLTVSLAQAEREGSPIGALLIRLADEAANARRRRAELAARRLPVQMLLPLVLCSLPAVVLGAVVPLLVVSLRRL